MFRFLKQLMEDIGNKPAAFHSGDMGRLKVNPTIRGQISVTIVPCGFGVCAFDYNLRREDGTLLEGLRAFELELDK